MNIQINFAGYSLHNYHTRIPSRAITIAAIQRIVADAFGMRLSEMTSARRSRDVARPRQIAMYLARHLTPSSLPQIGKRFGNRDHTTVMHAIRQIDRLRREDSEMDDAVRRLTSEVEA